MVRDLSLRTRENFTRLDAPSLETGKLANSRGRTRYLPGHTPSSLSSSETAGAGRLGLPSSGGSEDTSEVQMPYRFRGCPAPRTSAKPLANAVWV
jgi:hypothetical protein